MEAFKQEVQRIPRRPRTAVSSAESLEVEVARLRGVLADAAAIVDTAARESLLDQEPCFAFAMLRERRTEASICLAERRER
jgi:hypothetical protein